ncbi:hypothetical protein DRJ48_04845 [Candidatus Woesearchaeota archaeon]|nr:MAG: hypothetical protein DRJ48_04845 [Candidatus Woesearchaeota archaeon]
MSYSTKALTLICIEFLLLTLLLGEGLSTNSAIELLSPANQITTSQIPIFSFVLSQNATNCTLYLNQVEVGSVAPVIAAEVYNFTPQTLNEGSNEWYVACWTNQSIVSETRELVYDSTPPVIIVGAPIDNTTVHKDWLNITISVSEEAECKLSSQNTSFDAMTKVFQKGATKQWFKLVDLDDGAYVYFVKCRDRANNIGSTRVSFSVNLPITGEIDIDANTDSEGHYFLPAGRKKVVFRLSKPIDRAPNLYYRYEEGIKHDVALTGSGRKWYGYVIIDSRVNDKIAVFYASYENQEIEIVEGKMFVVDSQKPPAPASLKGEVLSGGGVELEWYYNGEEVDHYNVYRATTDKIDPLDLLIETKDTSYVDTGAEPGITYYYKVSAVDLAGNEGSMSPLLKITPGFAGPEPKRINPKVVAKVNLTRSLLNELKLDLETSKLNLNSIKDLKTKSLVEEFGYTTLIDSKLKELESYERLLDEAISKDEKYVNQKVEEIALFDKEVKSLVPSSVVFEGASETTQVISETQIEQVVREYLSITKPGLVEEEQLQNFLQQTTQLNDLLRIKNLVEVFNVKRIDGSTSTLTRIQKSITYSGTEQLSNVKLVEVIPKAMAQSAQELKLSTLGYEVIKQDPIIVWDLDNLGFEEKSITYYVTKSFELAEVDKLRSVVLPELQSAAGSGEGSSTGTTGYTVKESQASARVNIHKLLLSMGGLVLLSLLLYYLVYVKPETPQRRDLSLSKVTQPPAGQDKSSIQELVTKAHEQINQLNYNAAKHLYIYLVEYIQNNRGFASLKEEQKQELKMLYNKLVLFRSIAKCQRLFEEKQYEELSQLLQSIKPKLIQLRIGPSGDTKLLNYLEHWYYHYTNILEFMGKEK